MDRAPIRETGTGESNRPAPAGDFDGLTRAEALRRLLEAHKAPREEEVTRSSALRRALSAIGIALQVVVIAHGTIDWQGGPRLTPTEAAAILATVPSVANRTNVLPTTNDDGPHVYIAPCYDCAIDRVVWTRERLTPLPARASWRWQTIRTAAPIVSPSNRAWRGRAIEWRR